MPKAKATFIQQHVEKLTLGGCGLVLIGAVVYFLVLSPFKSGEGLGPAELCDAVARAADESRQRVGSRQHPPDTGSKSGARPDLDKVFGSGEDAGLIALAKIEPRYAPIVQWGATLIDTGSSDTGEKHELARLLPPEKPVARAGRATFRIPEAHPLEGMEKAGGESHEVNRGYAIVAAQLDLLAQGQTYRRAGYGPGKFDAPLVITGVQLQRRPAGDENAPWEDVATWTPFRPIELPEIQFTAEGRFASSDQGEALISFRKLVQRYADEIARTTPPEVVGKTPVEIRPRLPWLIEGDPKTEEMVGDEADAPSAPTGQMGRPGAGRAARKVVPVPERRFNKWMSLADQAMRSTPPELDLAAILLEAALGEEGVPPNLREKGTAKQKEVDEKRQAAGLPPIRKDPRRPEKMMPICALDLDATAGQTFVYRIRYEILNPFVGEPGEMKDPADAERLTLVSEWSPPSAPVEVRSDTYFYLASVNEKARTAQIEIYRLVSKLWRRDVQTVALGEPIGKSKKERRVNVNYYTGTTAVDILGADGGSLVYVDTADGRLHERSVARDALDPKRKELQELAGKTK